MKFDFLSDILMLFLAFLWICIVVFLAYESLFTLLLTIPLTIFSIAWLRTADWDVFLKR